MNDLDDDPPILIPDTSGLDDDNVQPLPVRVPMTIITGFLGSGKTTLLTYIMTENHGKRIAVIMNEFGDTQEMEKSLLVKPEGGAQVAEEWLELRNGCLCCSVKDVGLRAIELLMQRNHAAKRNFDYILLETTGLADPQPIIKSFWVDSDLCSDIYLDGVITLIDALNLSRHMAASIHEQTVRQIALGDRLIINKSDLIDCTELATLHSAVRNLNRVAPIYTTERSRIDLDKILDLHCYDERDSNFGTVLASIQDAHLDSTVSSITLTLPHATTRSAITRWLGSLVWCPPEELGPELWRVKGKLAIDNCDTVVLLQGVMDLFELLDTNDPWLGPCRQSHIVIIGRFLDYESMQTGILAACSH